MEHVKGATVLTEMTAPSALEEFDGEERADEVAEADKPAAGAFWADAVAPYALPDLRRSILGMLTSVVPYLALLVAMYFALRVTD